MEPLPFQPRRLSFLVSSLLTLLLWLSAVPLLAQSPCEDLESLPFQVGSKQWAPLGISKTTIPDSFVLPEGTPVPLEFLTLVTTRTARRSDRVQFQVVSDVLVEGLTVIPSGSLAWGTVVLAKKPGHFSRDGKLYVALETLTLLNRQTIAIRNRLGASTRADKWSINSTDSLQAPLLVPAAVAILALSSREDRDAFAESVVEGIFTKGHHIEMLPGTRIEAVISQRVNLNRDEFKNLQLPLPDLVLGAWP